MSECCFLGCLGVLAAAISLAPLRAQEDPCLKRTVLVNVIDQHGQLLTSLEPQNFRVDVRKRPLPVLSTSLDIRSQRIVVVLDSSWSMAYSPEKWKAAVLAAGDVLSATGQDVPIALLTFSTALEMRLDFAQGRKAIGKALEVLEAHPPAASSKAPRRTALLDAIQEGLRVLDAPRPGDVIYAITDGEDNASKTRCSQLKRLLLSAGVRLFGFFLYTPYYARAVTEPRMAQPEDLHALIRATGGNWVGLNPAGSRAYETVYYWATTQEEWSGILSAAHDMYRRMLSFYRLEIQLPEPVASSTALKVEVVDDRGKKYRGATVAYPRRLLPCAAEKKL